MKTDVFNLIILDESGSMGCFTKQTIDGCNETINTIKSAQEKYGETQNHYCSIFAFQSGGPVDSRYLLENVAAADLVHINDELYSPWGSTPLYDAMGKTINDLIRVVNSKELAVGAVTVITDGMENSSCSFTRPMIAELIKGLKDKGWTFNFIGANIDVDSVAASMNIDNRLKFDQSELGTTMMFGGLATGHMTFCERAHRFAQEEDAMCSELNISGEEYKKRKLERMKEAGENFFDESNA